MYALVIKSDYMEVNSLPTPNPDRLRDHSDTQIRLILRGLAADERNRRYIPGVLRPTSLAEKALEEAADRLQRYERLVGHLGLIAPAGTAPRTAIEMLYQESAVDTDEPVAAIELRNMLQPHWGEWTPALRQQEGLPAIES